MMGSEASYCNRWVEMGGFAGSGLASVFRQGIRSVKPLRTKRKAMTVWFDPRLRVQAGEGLEEEVDPLVVEFASPRNHHDPRIVGQIPIEEPAGGGEELIAGLEGETAVRREVGDVFHVQTVRRDQIRRRDRGSSSLPGR